MSDLKNELDQFHANISATYSLLYQTKTHLTNHKKNTLEMWKGKTSQYLFIWHVLRSFRPAVIARNRRYKNSIFMMTGNNFKIAFRVMWRDPFNTFMNLGGLAIGIACFLLIGFFVKQELSYDKFHVKKDRIYRVWLKEVYAEDKVFFNSITPLIFEKTLEDNFGEIETVVQYDKISFLVGETEDRHNESIGVISPEFFSVFINHSFND